MLTVETRNISGRRHRRRAGVPALPHVARELLAGRQAS